MNRKGYGYIAIKENIQLRKNCYEKVIYYLNRISNNKIMFKDDCDEVYSFIHHDGNENEVAIENIKGAKLVNNSLYIISDTNSFNYNENCDNNCIFDVLLLIEKEIDIYSYNQILDLYIKEYKKSYSMSIKKPNYLTDNEFNDYINHKTKLIFESLNEDIKLNYPLLDCNDADDWENDIKENLIIYIQSDIVEK